MAFRKKYGKRSYKKKTWKSKAKRKFRKSYKAKKATGFFQKKRSNHASITESRDVTVPMNAAPVMAADVLANYSRASLVAQAYQYYRLKKITYRYLSNFNTYPAAPITTSATWLETTPKMVTLDLRRSGASGYAQLAYSGSTTAEKLAYMIELGCQFRDHTRTETVQYVPTIEANATMLTATPAAGALTNAFTPQRNRWISTAKVSQTDVTGINDQVIWYGHAVAFTSNQIPAGSAPGVPDVPCQVTAVWEFKEPWKVDVGL